MTTAAGLMLLYTWLFILFSGKKLLETTKMGTAQIVIALVLIVAAVSGTLFEKSSRPGFLVSLCFLAVIAIVTWIVQKAGTQPCRIIAYFVGLNSLFK